MLSIRYVNKSDCDLFQMLILQWQQGDCISLG